MICLDKYQLPTDITAFLAILKRTISTAIIAKKKKISDTLSIEEKDLITTWEEKLRYATIFKIRLYLIQIRSQLEYIELIKKPWKIIFSLDQLENKV